MVMGTDKAYLTDDSIRARCTPKPTDGEWAYLVKKRYVAEVAQGELAIDGLGKEVRLLRKVSGPAPVKPVGVAGPLATTAVADWAGALAVVLATEANRDPDVAAFRNEVLDGRLFATLQAAVDWLQLMAADGEVTGHAVKALPYQWPDSEYEHNVPARSTTAIRLADLGVALADRYGWHRAQATMFVLCGATPAPGTYSVTSRFAAPAWKCRIVIEAHPMYDPKKIEADYREARRQFLGWAFAGQRIRRRETRAYRVAAWVAQNDADNWADMLRAWNAEHTDDPMPNSWTLRRIATRGLESVMGPGTRWELGGE